MQSTEKKKQGVTLKKVITILAIILALGALLITALMMGSEDFRRGFDEGYNEAPDRE